MQQGKRNLTRMQILVPMVAEYDDDEDGKRKEFKEKDGDLYLQTVRLNRQIDLLFVIKKANILLRPDIE